MNRLALLLVVIAGIPFLSIADINDVYNEANELCYNDAHKEALIKLEEVIGGTEDPVMLRDAHAMAIMSAYVLYRTADAARLAESWESRLPLTATDELFLAYCRARIEGTKSSTRETGQSLLECCQAFDALLDGFGDPDRTTIRYGKAINLPLRSMVSRVQSLQLAGMIRLDRYSDFSTFMLMLQRLHDSGDLDKVLHYPNWTLFIKNSLFEAHDRKTLIEQLDLWKWDSPSWFGLYAEARLREAALAETESEQDRIYERVLRDLVQARTSLDEQLNPDISLLIQVNKQIERVLRVKDGYAASLRFMHNILLPCRKNPALAEYAGALEQDE